MFSKDGSVNYVISNGAGKSLFTVGNFHDYGMKRKNAGERIRILDTTLRDGEQSPGVSITVSDKVKIAGMLEEAGIDVIEAGFPAASEAERSAVSSINSVVSRSEVCALARCVPGDVEAAIATGVKRIHLFIATSDIHLKHKLRMTREEVLSAVSKNIGDVMSRGIEVEFSSEDATRTDMDYLKSVYLTARDSGADVMNIPDTVGAYSPPAMARIVAEVMEATGSRISVHCHDDFGLATANTLFGIMAGATQAHVTVNGIGERAGNASLEEVVLGIESFFSEHTGVKMEKISELSREVSLVTGMKVQPNKAIVGENAFAHEAGIHVHGVISDASTYEPIDPAIVGAERRIVIGKHSGAKSIMWVLQKNGIKAGQAAIKHVLRDVKSISDSGGRVDEAMVVEMFMGIGEVNEIEGRQQ